jgi:choline-sulfatase
MIGHHGLLHKGNAVWLVEGKQGSRPNMFDDAIRVPLLVRWPAVVKPGTVITRVVSNLDIFPTVLEATGIGAPPNLKIEGRSVVPLLTGNTDADALNPPWNDTLFGQYDMKHGQRARMRMIRTTEWKLIRHFEPNVADELYRLSTDPGELKNLIAEPRFLETRATLTKALNDRMKELKDPLADLTRTD